MTHYEFSHLPTLAFRREEVSWVWEQTADRSAVAPVQQRGRSCILDCRFCTVVARWR